MTRLRPTSLRAAAALCALTLAAAGAHAQAPAAPPASPPAVRLAPPPGGAPARPAPPPTPVATDASRKEAQALSDKLGIASQAQSLLENVRAQIAIGLARVNNKTPDEMVAVVDQVMMPDFTSRIGELTNGFTEVWAANFTADELRKLRDFYNTPLGEKLLRTVPAINQQSLQFGQAWAQRIYQSASAAHTSELASRGLKLSAPNAPAPPAPPK